MATTTIQVQEETAQILKRLKEQTGAKTYDDLIRSLTSPKQLKEAAAGYLSKYISQKDYEWMQKNLREKNDRVFR